MSFSRYFGFLILFLASLTAYSQSDCGQTLRLARSTYDEGRLHAIPEQLKSCLENDGFNTQQEKVEAYRILVLTYIYLEEPALADENMLKILQTDPYFKPTDGIDPPEFIALYNTFRHNPIYRFGIRAGINATLPGVTRNVYVVDGKAEYKSKIDLQSGFVAEIPLTKRLDRFTINPELHFELRSFSYTSTYQVNPPASGENKTEGTESHAIISIPVLVQYDLFPGSKFNGYIAAGGSANYLLSADLTLERTRVNATPVSPSSTDLNPQRQKISFDAVVAFGGKYRMGGGFAIGEVRLNYGITKMNESSAAYENQQLALSYGYADNIFKVNSLSFTVGYIQNFFKPKKLTPKR